MNTIFRVIWNGMLQRYVVTSELAKGKTKSQSSRVTVDDNAPDVVALSRLAMALTVALSSFGAYATGTVVANGTTVQIDGQDIVPTGTGQNAWGMSASNNALVDFTHGTITTGRANGYGAVVDTGAVVAFKDTEISTAGGTSHGLYAKGAASVTAEAVNITTGGATSYGVQASNGSITLTDSTIKTTGAAGMGAVAMGTNGNIAISDSNISTTGDNGHALYATGNGQITVSGSTLKAEGHMTYAAWANGAGSVINIHNSNLSTEGSSSEVVVAKAGGTINLTQSTINSSRINSYGLRALNAGSTVNFDGGTITTTGGTDAVQANGVGSAINVLNATVNTGSNGLTAVYGTVTAENIIINNDGAGAPGSTGAGVATRFSSALLTLKNAQVNSTRDNLLGARARDGSRITLDNVEFNHSVNGTALAAFLGGTISGDQIRATIVSQDGLAMSSGVWMGNGVGDNQVTLTRSHIGLTGANSAGLLSQSDIASNNTLSLTDSTLAATDGTAVMVSGAANTVVTTSGTLLSGATLLSAGVGNSGALSDVVMTGDNGSVFNGDVMIDRTNTRTNIINLDHGSVWNGSTTTLENLNLAHGSQWNVTSHSAVDNLTLDNASLNMAVAGSGFSDVTLGSLTSTQGTLYFNTRLGDDGSQSDRLHITGDYTGNSQVVVQNAGGSGARTLNGIELIRVDGNVNGTFTQQGRIVAGAYDYRLVQDASKWLLSNSVNQDSNSASDGAAIVRPEAGSYAANQAASNTLFTTNLDNRLGETHYIDANGHEQVTSLWLRNAAGHQRFSDNSGQLKTTGNRYVMQMGGDVAQWSSTGNDRFHLGVMAGYASTQNNTRSAVTGYSAKGQVHGYSSGLYATWLQDSADKTGAYLDSWALYNWFDNSVSGEGVGEESYKSKGITAALEAGYTFKVVEVTPRQSIYLQPKSQFSWMGVKANDHQENNGTRVMGEGNNNVQTRLGVRAFIKGHNQIDDGKNRTFEPFIEANWLHNSEAFGSSLNGVNIHQAGARNLGELKVGVDAKLNKTVNLWGNIGQQMGDKGYSDTSAMLGVKVNF